MHSYQPASEPIITVASPFSKSPILNDKLDSPQKELNALHLPFQPTSFFNKLEPSLSSPKQLPLHCNPPAIKDLQPRMPRSPLAASISQLPLPDAIEAIQASDSDAIMRFVAQKDTLIIDVRPFNAYSSLRVMNSINICLPTTLLKRASFDFAHVVNSSTISQALKDSLLEDSKHFKILLYDQASESSRVSIQLYHTIMKFYEGSNFSVAYLNGGFQGVDQQLKDTIQTLPIRSPDSVRSRLPNAEHFSDQSDNAESAPFLTGFTLPSATDPDVKLLNCIKKNVPTIDTKTKYYHKFEFPDNFAQLKDKLPSWLLFIADSYGKENCSELIVDHLSERFNRLEASEQVRLSLAINNADGTVQLSSCGSLHDTSGYGTPLELCPCCDDITYTIPKGVEYGYKNRYKNVWPYEHSRVRLRPSPSCKSANHDDYFNANYIHFEEISDNRYIATQDPLEATNEDFWNTVWYNGVQAIICLDNSVSLHGRKYYEKDNEYKNLSIRIKLVLEHQGYTLREINMVKNKELRVLYHFAYTDWPDFGTPDDLQTVIDMMKVKDKMLSNVDPVQDSWELLVHCSAGCGRTGCYITLDMVASLFAAEPLATKMDPWGSEDLIYKSVQFQRQQRISMVQNLGQFIFCYESVLNYILKNLL